MSDIGPQGQLALTIVEGHEILRREGPEAGTRFVIEQSTALEPSIRAEFRQAAVFNIAIKGLIERDLEAEGPLQFIDQLPDSVEWGNTLANTGLSLARNEDPTLALRGRRLLFRAANKLQNGYEKMIEEKAPLKDRTRVLLDDYFRVATLQDQVGDAPGARLTTETIAPHLIKLSEEIKDPDQRIELENVMSWAISNLGGLHTKEARTLFRSIETEDIQERVLRILTENIAKDLLEVGRVKEAVNTIAGQNEEPLLIWSRAARLWKEGDRETVSQFIDAVQEKWPGYYCGCDGYIANGTKMLDVLAEANRDDLLIEAFRSLLSDNTDIGPIERFATWCGLYGHGQRLKEVVSKLSLTSEQKNLVYESFQKGKDDAQATQGGSE